MMMKRINLPFLLAVLLCCAVSLPAIAGGLLHNTNVDATFARMMARGASTEVDAAHTNPAGTAWLDHEGWSLSFTNQSAFQTRDIVSTFPLFPEPDHTRKYAPMSALRTFKALKHTHVHKEQTSV